MLAVCEQAARAGLRVGLYGGEPDVTADVRASWPRRLPRLDVALLLVAALSASSRPPKTTTPARRSSAAAVDVLFVSLGCPKQERWMLAHRDRLPCVMLGVGAAFDMLTGRVGVAPQWMQRAGLEWLYRFCPGAAPPVAALRAAQRPLRRAGGAAAAGPAGPAAALSRPVRAAALTLVGGRSARPRRSRRSGLDPRPRVLSAAATRRPAALDGHGGQAPQVHERHHERREQHGVAQHHDHASRPSRGR